MSTTNRAARAPLGLVVVERGPFDAMLTGCGAGARSTER